MTAVTGGDGRTTRSWVSRQPACSTARRTHRDGLSRAQAFARLWAQHTVDQNGGHFTDIRLDGPGEEAWLIQGNDFPGGPQVTHGWRRANLVLQVHIQCIWRYCFSDIRSAARAWADAIDDEARTRQ
jgi:hypothetical protein